MKKIASVLVGIISLAVIPVGMAAAFEVEGDSGANVQVGGGIHTNAQLGARVGGDEDSNDNGGDEQTEVRGNLHANASTSIDLRGKSDEHAQSQNHDNKGKSEDHGSSTKGQGDENRSFGWGWLLRWFAGNDSAPAGLTASSTASVNAPHASRFESLLNKLAALLNISFSANSSTTVSH